MILSYDGKAVSGISRGGDKRGLNKMRSILSRIRRLLVWLVVIVVVLVVAAVGGGWYYFRRYLPAQVSTAETMQTTRVRRGSLILSVGGSGSLIPGSQADLGFSSGGVVSEVLVEVGDWVESGQVLARIDPAALERAVSQAEAELTVAQESVETTQNPYNQLDLNQAYLAVEQAETALAAARQALSLAQEPSVCMYESVIDLEYEYSWYEENYYQEADEHEAGESSREELDAASNQLQWAEERLNEAVACPPGPEDVAVCENDYAWYQGRYAEMGGKYAAGEISQEQLFALWDRLQAVQARLGLARQAASAVTSAEGQVAEGEYNLQKAQQALAEMRSDPDDAEVQVAQAKLLSAQAVLEDARAALKGATIVAPFGGLITAVEAQMGSSVGTEAIINLADMAHPEMEMWVDEVDVGSVAVGYDVEVIFDALPDDVFIGHVIVVEPELQSMQNAPTVLVYASLDEEPELPPALPIGANATVEIIAARAENALLVPVEALRELSAGQYAVFVMVDDELQMRQVEVGVMDYAYAEIISGLEQGDVVSTGVVSTE
ncbi:MAG: efflux RND transporter periplasmic adaptor subunit [Anaerolineae bacterium]|nr:efflux RND transporter periplasmic adaptor subunit [Anaerolineae bacterium]